jgi:hypothetical protein
MKTIIGIILILVLAGCAELKVAADVVDIFVPDPKPPERTEFICVADINKNSRCEVVPCSEVNNICKTGKYRVLKNYVTGYAYVYSLDPFTDMDRCRKAVGQ